MAGVCAVLLNAALANSVLSCAALAQQSEVRMLVQSSPLAGFRYYQASQVWERMQVGDALELVREPKNIHDDLAIRVEWRGLQLGYVPRADNRAVAAHLDRGGRVEARISKLREHPNPRQRFEFEVLVRL